jgi:hypothetical protein
MVETKSVLGQLASVGEGAFGKLSQSPTTHRVIEGAMLLKERVERLVTGFEALEQRLTAVEQRLDALEKPKRTTTRKTSTPARKTTTTAKKKTPAAD